MSDYKNEYKKVFKKALKRLKNKNTSGISMVEKAFSFAEEKHTGQFRKSGIPYIDHPVAVMNILEKLDFGSDVLCGALLHDVVEDCGVTVKEIEKEFNISIAQIVDAVTAIKPKVKTQSIEAELKTYQKLVSMGKINRFAFYIKFADRLHNLKTLSVFPKYKQVEKIKQTQRFVTPLSKILKAKFLYDKITNESFKVLCEKEDFEPFEKMYLKNLKANKFFNQMLHENLVLLVNSLLSKYKINNTLKRIIITPLEELRVKSEIDAFYETKSLKEINYNYFVNVPTFHLYFVFSKPNYKNLIFKLLEETMFKDILKLYDFSYDGFSGKEYFLFQNKARTKFKTFFFSQSEYNVYRNGSEEGIFAEVIEEDFEEEIIADFMTVKTRSNEVLLMPVGSTVLDFAFKIHNDFGFSCKYAHLNNSPSKTPIYTKLSDGDKVDLVVEEDTFGSVKYIAKLKWLTYANNEKSKKLLLKYFENMYE